MQIKRERDIRECSEGPNSHLLHRVDKNDKKLAGSLSVYKKGPCLCLLGFSQYICSPLGSSTPLLSATPALSPTILLLLLIVLDIIPEESKIGQGSLLSSGDERDFNGLW